MERLRARLASKRDRLFSFQNERQRLWQELLRVNQQCIEEERFISEATRKLDQSEEISERFAKEGAELEARAAGVREMLTRLRSDSVVDPAAQAAANLAVDLAFRPKDEVIAKLSQFQIDFGL